MQPQVGPAASLAGAAHAPEIASRHQPEQAHELMAGGIGHLTSGETVAFWAALWYTVTNIDASEKSGRLPWVNCSSAYLNWQWRSY
jgi:hypothetical protein